ncbi:MAG TPA: hypothetical protein VMS22_04875 [Candidatus Eisenbacteria bacterium]|nr:hypothetical protein [Candidatus Eisenbacteria bacterium]
MSDSIANIEWGECWLEPTAMPRELAADIRRALHGVVPAWSARLASVPWVAREFPRLSGKSIAHMPLDLWEMIGLVVSQDNSCRYCYGVTRVLLRVLGYDAARVQQLERDLNLADVSPADRLALDFARRVSHANPRVGAPDYSRLLEAGYSKPAIAEIAYCAATNVCANRIATLLAFPPDFTPAERVVMRLLRPLVARRIRGKLMRPEPLPPNIGPCADVVAALDGSPAARVLRTAIDEAIASPVLPRRTKLLMLAVIGKALGCAYSEREASVELAQAGLGPADVAEILTNLGSPKLDRREALLVPFARETVWYQVPVIQRRTRELARHLTRDELIEAVGIASLANGVCRLSILLETC